MEEEVERDRRHQPSLAHDTATPPPPPPPPPTTTTTIKSQQQQSGDNTDNTSVITTSSGSSSPTLLSGSDDLTRVADKLDSVQQTRGGEMGVHRSAVVGGLVKAPTGPDSEEGALGTVISSSASGSTAKGSAAVQGGSAAVQSPTTPRQPSKRDSGYHTDCSPATFTPGVIPATHFTFESPDSPPPPDTLSSSQPLSLMEISDYPPFSFSSCSSFSASQTELPSPIMEHGGGEEGELPPPPPPPQPQQAPPQSSLPSSLRPLGQSTPLREPLGSLPESPGLAEEYDSGPPWGERAEERPSPRAESQTSQGSSGGGEPGLSGAGSTPVPRPPAQSAPPRQKPRSLFPSVPHTAGTDDEEDCDDDAFVPDDVAVEMTSRLPGSAASVDAATQQQQQEQQQQQRHQEEEEEEVEEQEEKSRESEFESRVYHGHPARPTRFGGGYGGVGDDELGRGKKEDGGRSKDRGGQDCREVGDDDEHDDDVEDNDDDDDDEEGTTGVASTAFYHGPLSATVRLPGGGRMRPLLARTTATQTPHLLCQQIRQVLHVHPPPAPLPHCARGNAVQRPRCYSEGEMDDADFVASVTSGQGPLPDLVPVSPASRERSHSSPDAEALRRQCQSARAVGRELRRISDEFVRNHELARQNRELPNGLGMVLALFHAELNGVLVGVLRGVRRLLRADVRAYLRAAVLWARHTIRPVNQHPPDSPVDSER